MKRDVRCILCPSGCVLTVENLAGKVKVRGAGCLRGEEFGRNEIKDPLRPLTTTVRVKGGTLPVIPVHTVSHVPRDKMKDCVQELKKMVISAPINKGDVIVTNLLGQGIRVVTSRSMRREPSSHADY